MSEKRDKNRIIVNNRSGLSDLDALALVYKVVEMGRISDEGRSYCYATGFKIDGKQYFVYAERRRSGTGDTFYVTQEG